MFARRTVKATDVDQFEQAFRQADRIVVEGDDRLLAYAASRAAGGPPPADAATSPPNAPEPVDQEDRRPPPSALVPLENEPPTPVPGWTDWSGGPPSPMTPAAASFDDEPSPMASASGAPPRAGRAAPPATAAATRGGSAWIFISGLILLLGVGGFAAWRYLGHDGSAPVAAGAPTPATANHEPTPAPVAPSKPAPADLPPPTATKSAASGPVLPTLIWPVVALVALVLMYLLARQAIAGGSNVKLEWKVTEKVSGRIVITRVRGS